MTTIIPVNATGRRNAAAADVSGPVIVFIVTSRPSDNGHTCRYVIKLSVIYHAIFKVECSVAL